MRNGIEQFINELQIYCECHPGNIYMWLLINQISANFTITN